MWTKSWLTGKTPCAAKDWKQNEKEAAEDEMVGWHHQLNGHEFEQTPGDSGRQRSLACYSPWGCNIGHNLVTEQQHDSPKKLDVISCTGPQALEPQGKREMWRVTLRWIYVFWLWLPWNLRSFKNPWQKRAGLSRSPEGRRNCCRTRESVLNRTWPAIKPSGKQPSQQMARLWCWGY